MLPCFVRVIPHDYRRVLEAQARMRATGLSGDEAAMAAFEENARDLARAGGVLMGNPTAFIQVQRRPSPTRPPLERVKDWSETHPRLSDDELAEQGSRCMDCGIPYCHTGVLISGMASGCPINNLIPEWNDLVYRGQWREASLRLDADEQLPRVHGPGLPGAVRGVVHGRASTATRSRSRPSSRRSPTGPGTRAGSRRGRRRVRTGPVRGGRSGPGPAGLAAADQLNRSGHAVTVFERAGRIGGLLMYGIPNMKLDKDVVDRRVGLMEAEGVTFRTGVTVGADVAADELLAEFDAVVLATGATVARDLPVAGPRAGRDPPRDELPARQHAPAAGRRRRRRAADQRRGPRRRRHRRRRHRDRLRRDGDPAGREAACASSSCSRGRRCSARPTTRGPSGPRSTSWTTARRRPQALWGEDPRRYATTTRRFIGRNEHVTGIEIADVTMAPGADGRIALREVPGTNQVIPADLVLLALGLHRPGARAAEGVRLRAGPARQRPRRRRTG